MPRWSSTSGRVAWVGPSGAAPDADERLDVDGRAVVPGFVDSHNHLVFAGDRADEFAARMAGQPYAAGGIASTVAATRAAPDERLAANLRRLVGRDAGRRDHDVRVQERLRAHRRRRGAVAAHRTRGHGRDDVPRRARRAGGVRGRPGRVRRPRPRPHARRMRAVRTVGRRLLRPGRVRRRRGARDPRRRHRPWAAASAARQPAPARARRAGRGRARRGERRPLHAPGRRRRRRPRGVIDRRDPAAGRGVLDPVAVPGRAPPPRRRARPWRWRPTATPGRRTRRAWRCASRSPYARCG